MKFAFLGQKFENAWHGGESQPAGPPIKYLQSHDARKSIFYPLRSAYLLLPRVMSGTSDCGLLSSVLWPSKLVSLSRSYAARRRVWRMVGVGMRLLRHYREVEGIVVEDDAVLVLSVRGRARYAQAHVPKQRSHHRVPRVLQCWLLRHEELVGRLGSTVDFFEKSHHRGAHSSTS